jgi:hypothetical protein
MVDMHMALRLCLNRNDNFSSVEQKVSLLHFLKVPEFFKPGFMLSASAFTVFSTVPLSPVHYGDKGTLNITLWQN